MEEIREELKKYPESKIYLSTPPVIPGLGSSGGFEMVLEARSDASYADLQRAADTLLYYASQRKRDKRFIVFYSKRYTSALF